MPKYIGATIGPIVDTLLESESTKQIWGASYLFSYIMKTIISELQDKKFIVPYVDEESLKSGKKAGLFHDRFIFEVKDEKRDFNKVIEIKDKVLEKLALEMNISKEILDKYIRFNIVEIETNEKIIKTVSKYLDTLELQPQMCIEKLKTDPILEYLKNPTLLEEDAFGKKNHMENHTETLPEIAVKDIIDRPIISDSDKEKIKEYFKHQVEEDDKKTYKILSKYKEFKKHHKYYATVRADGDNIGKIIDILDENEIQEFSKRLFKFSEGNVGKISDYGGLLIYAGGDDLLFFAPIINRKSENKAKNIFSLIAMISEGFKEKIEEKYKDKLKEKEIEKRPTLSFGIDIRYYKDPMSKSLSDSHYMLEGKAKKYEGEYGKTNKDKKDENKEYEKNAVGLKLNKHSGTEIDFTVSKKSELYFILKEMVDENYETRLLKGVMHTLESQKFILKNIIKDKEKVENFFENNFKKDIHEDLSYIKKLITNCNSKKDIEKSLNILKFIAFLNEKGGE